MANTTGKKFGGRKKGTPNKTTSEIRARAQEYGPEAIRRLVSLMRQSDDRKVQFAAAREVLSRGYGPPTGPVDTSHVDTGLDARAWLLGRLGQEVASTAPPPEEVTQPVIRPSGELQIGSKA